MTANHRPMDPRIGDETLNKLHNQIEATEADMQPRVQDFQRALEEIISKYNIDNFAGIPDYALARLLVSQVTFIRRVEQGCRDNWGCITFSRKE